MPDGDVTVMELPELTVTPVAGLPPKSTVTPRENPEPTIVTDVPPPTGPLSGDTPVTVGAP